MDKYDKEILSVLLENGKIQLSELSKKTNLSVSSCQRRVKNLEESGVIESYQAVVNPKLVGMGFQALVFITLSQAAGEKSQNLKKLWKRFLHHRSASDLRRAGLRPSGRHPGFDRLSGSLRHAALFTA